MPAYSKNLCSNLIDKTLEGFLTQEEISGSLIAADLTESNRPRAVAMWLLHSSGIRGGFVGGLCCKLFARCFPSCGFASRLLGACHGGWWFCGC